MEKDRLFAICCASLLGTSLSVSVQRLLKVLTVDVYGKFQYAYIDKDARK